MAETLSGHAQDFPPDSAPSAGSAPRPQILKDRPDSGYAAAAETTYNSPDNVKVEDITSLASASSYNSSNASFNATLPVRPTFRKTETESSAVSLASCKSITVTGALAFGSLHVVQPRTPVDEKTAEAVEAEHEIATQRCLAMGDVFLILGGLPANFTIGCDATAITTTGKVEFHGFRDLPPGPHFVWVSAPGAMTRSGYWFVTERRDGDGVVRVAQWDAYNEVLGEPASKFEAMEARKGVEKVKDRLLPYQSVTRGQSSTAHGGTSSGAKSISNLSRAALELAEEIADSDWGCLTTCITESLLQRVTGRHEGAEFLFDTTDSVKGEIAAGLFPFSPPTTSGTSSGLAKSTFSTEINFLFPPNEIDADSDERTQTDDVSPAMRRLSLSHKSQKSNPIISRTNSDDITTTISTILSFSATPITESDLIGEFQLAFLTALHLSSPACAAHWWRLLLHVFLRAYDLLTERPKLAGGIMAALKAQMAYAERKVDVGNGDGKDDDGLPASGGEATGSTEALEFLAALAETNSSGGYDLDITGAGRRSRKPSQAREGYLGRLRSALAKYKRHLEGVLLDGRRVTAEQAAVGERFRELEAWFWRVGWDLREESGDLSDGKVVSDPMERKIGADGCGDDEEDDDEYAPVVVQLDERGREVGLVSWN